ncbi:MAG: 23S rRNA (adenine(2503)-C(2))-methyltransferase RlmN [Acidimicrobiia bacterium]|nr:23S rRNA (adenine(2503)-C(2))-methyltransferase RlmN [Acidimicrobiia bacterium]
MSTPLLLLDDTELAGVVGPPAFRVRQVKRWLYEVAETDPRAMTDLPTTLREHLSTIGVSALETAEKRLGDGGMTVKWLHTSAGAEIETVLMRYPRRTTVCVSSQAGCAMRCPFCATGQGGFARQLAAGEIIEQVLVAARWLRDEAGGEDGDAPRSPTRIGNVVFMGMGEPLANYTAVVGAVQRLRSDCGIGARHITVSTIGIPDRIRTLANDAPPVTLAWSLHAPHDDLRDRLVPPNRRWPVADVRSALHDWRSAGGRRITIEYALIDGINDMPELALRVASIARDLEAHVNCIPLNPTGGTAYRPSPHGRIRAFVSALREAGANATLRQNRGAGIDAACGQLRARHGLEHRTR